MIADNSAVEGSEARPRLLSLATGDLPRAPALVLLAIAVGAGYAVALMLWPFLPAIVTSAAMAVLVHPLLIRCRRHTRNASAAAMITTLLVFFLGLLPAIGIGVLLVHEVRTGIEYMTSGTNQVLSPIAAIANSLDSVLQRFGLQPGQFKAMLSEQLQRILGVFVARTVAVFTGLGGWLLQAGVALFTLYYLLRDGESLITRLRWLLPLAPQLNDRLFRQAYEVTHATIYGNIMVAIVQGLLGGVSFWLLGIPSPIVWGTLMGLLSLLPVLGAFLVWIPAAILLLTSGHVVKGIILLAFGTFIISTIDNVLRAFVVAGRAQMHPLVVFFSVLGGLLLFGAVGLLLGPVLFVVSLTLIEVARRSLDGAGPLEGSAVAESTNRVDSVWA